MKTGNIKSSNFVALLATFAGLMIWVAFTLMKPLDQKGNAPTVKNPTMRVENVVRVFMHTPGDYTIMYEKGDEYATIRFRNFNKCGNSEIDAWAKEHWFLSFDGLVYRTTIKPDVAPNEPMRVDLAKSTSDSSILVTIHIRSVEDIGGGGWEKKNSKGHTIERGNTQVVK